MEQADRKPRLSRRGRIGLVCLGILFAGGYWFFAQGPLPHPARPLVSRPYWHLRSAGPNVRQNVLAMRTWAEAYLWLNDREILAFDSTSPLHTRAERIDTITGKVTLLPALSPAFAGQEPYGRCFLSADKRRLLWFGQKDVTPARFSGRLTRIDRFVTGLNGTTSKSDVFAGSAGIGSGIPLDGDDDWADVGVGGSKVIVPSVSNGKFDLVTIPHKSSLIPRSGESISGAWLTGSMTLGRTADKGLIYVAWIPNGVVLYSIRTLKPPSVHVTTISCASGEDIFWAVVSPGGDRIAWVAYRANAPQFVDRLRRLIPIFPSTPPLTVELRISRTDGTAMRPVYQFNVPDGTQGVELDEFPHSVQWTPDGKRLSFLYRGMLYAIPADG